MSASRAAKREIRAHLGPRRVSYNQAVLAHVQNSCTRELLGQGSGQHRAALLGSKAPAGRATDEPLIGNTMSEGSSPFRSGILAGKASVSADDALGGAVMPCKHHV